MFAEKMFKASYRLLFILLFFRGTVAYNVNVSIEFLLLREELILSFVVVDIDFQNFYGKSHFNIFAVNAPKYFKYLLSFNQRDVFSQWKCYLVV